MKLDGVDVAEANRLMRALGHEVDEPKPTAPEPALPAAKEDINDLKSDAVLGKYAKMAAMGVPHGSVQAKMKLDGVDLAEANRLMRALGHEVEGAPAAGPARPGPGSILSALAAGPGGGQLRSQGPAASSSASAPAPAPARRSTVQLQNIHWNTVPEDRLKKSVWASADAAGADEIQESDLEELAKLFGAAQAKGGAGPGGRASGEAWGAGGAGSGSGAGAGGARRGSAAGPDAKDEAAKKSMQLHALDGKRAQNVVIGLAQYKSITQDMFALLRAVCSLDSMGGRVSADHLENLQPLLPTGPEIKRLADLAGSTHPAEVFIRTAASFYPELPRRLQCFLTCSTFRASAAAAGDKARLLVSACKEVISSDKLARLLQKMLAVGNVMNQGTYRGQASGFTVDSLLKMIQTKGEQE